MSKVFRTRSFAWDSGEKDANNNQIVDILRCGHISSNDPSDSSKAKHATAFSVNQVHTALNSLSSGLTNTITAVVNEKIQSGEIAAGGSGGGSDVSVVGTPTISGQYAIIGASTDFVISSYAGLADSSIASFKVNLTGCAEQTVTATNGAATVSFTIANDVAVGTELTLTAVAYDNNGNASRTATAAITATNAAVAAPSITAPASGDVIVYNEGFDITGTAFALMGAGSDTHANTRIIFKNHSTGATVKTLTKTAANVYSLATADMSGMLGGVYDIVLQYEGTTLGWGVQSLPVTVTLKSAIRAPAVIEPVEGASFFYVGSLNVRCGVFTTDFLADTFSKRTYQLRDAYDNVVVTREVTNQNAYNFGDLTGIIASGSYRLYVKDTGVNFGDSDWTGPIAVTSRPTSAIISDLLLPANGAQVARIASLKVQLDDPPTSAGAASVESCDFQICTGSDGSGIFLSASESGQAHTFSHAETSENFELNETYYARARHHLTNGEVTGWGTALFLTAFEGMMSDSGRILYLDNNCIVIEYTYQERARKIETPVAQYRKRQDTAWATSQTLVTDLYQHSSWATNFADSGCRYIYRQLDANNIPQHVAGNTATIDASSYAQIGPVTDAQLDAWMQQMFQHEDKTAEECTDIILAQFGNTNAPAAAYCRSLTALRSGGFSLPLFHDLAVLYVEGDNIDSLDPTVDDYPAFALGKKGSNTRWMNGGNVWSCQQYNSSYALYMYYSGYADNNRKTSSRSVVPVREI